MKSDVKKNFAFQVMYQILLIIAPLVTAPYISRVLGPENVGINAYSYSITTYFMMVAALGIENYGSRTIAQCRNDRDKINVVFSEIFLVHIVEASIVFIAFIVFCVFFVQENKTVFLIQSLYVLGIVFDVNWVYSGLELFKTQVVKNCVLKILSVVCIFIFVRSTNDLLFYVIVLALLSFLNYFVLLFGIRRHVSFVKVDVRKALIHVRPLLVLFLPAIAALLYKYMDKIMLGEFVGKTSVAYYDSGERIITLVIGIINALGTVMLPRVSNLVASGEKGKVSEYFQKSILLIGFLSVGLGFGAYGVAQEFIPFFFGNQYEPSIAVMKVLAFSLPFTAIANVVKTQYVLPNKKDNFFAIVLVLGAILNFSINVILIPKCGATGAAIGTVVTEMFICLIQVCKSNTEMNTFRQVLSNWGFLVAGIVMIFVMGLFSEIENKVFRLVIKITIGSLSYLSVTLVFLLIGKKAVLLQAIGRIKKIFGGKSDNKKLY